MYITYIMYVIAFIPLSVIFLYISTFISIYILMCSQRLTMGKNDSIYN